MIVGIIERAFECPVSGSLPDYHVPFCRGPQNTASTDLISHDEAGIFSIDPGCVGILEDEVITNLHGSLVRNNKVAVDPYIPRYEQVGSRQDGFVTCPDLQSSSMQKVASSVNDSIQSI